MRRIKAIVYGVGTMGKIMTRYMVEKGVDIVGAIDVNRDIVGKDLGEVAGLGRPLNVKISDNADTVLSEQEADIAIVAVFTQMDRMYPIFKQCIENGLNVLTLSEEALYPWEVSPQLAAKLDKLAKKHGVTISASGTQDSFRVNLMAVLTGASHTIESISVRQTGDLSQSGQVAMVNYHIGETKDEFYQKTREKRVPLSTLTMCLEAIIADLGLTIKKEEQSAEPATDEMDVEAKSFGIVKKGLVNGMTKIIDIGTEEGIKFHGEQTMKVFNEDEKAEGELNECYVKGVPALHLRITIHDIEAKSSIAAHIINRISDVINSEPGYITVEKLAKLKFRAFPLQCYLKRGGEK